MFWRHTVKAVSATDATWPAGRHLYLERFDILVVLWPLVGLQPIRREEAVLLEHPKHTPHSDVTCGLMGERECVWCVYVFVRRPAAAAAAARIRHRTAHVP